MCTLVVAFVLVAAWNPNVYVKRNWMDPETRAEKHQTQLFGISFSAVVTETPLDARLSSMGVAHTHSWQFLHEISSSAIGSRTYGCGSAPAIYQFPDDMIKDFVVMSSDSQIMQFVWTMKSGTDAQQQAAVVAACERVFRAQQPVNE